jgi:G6PDH family F420-dependent oxidoreductase
MTTYGYTLFSEMNDPKSLIEQAVAAEEAGFDFAVISDHFHPWLDSHTDSPFAWSVLGAVADRTEKMKLGTLVTCPFLRYHPAIVAQAAATIQAISDGRFTLALGSGENLNEHIVGRGWPSIDIRQEMLEESIDIIRQLWDGGFVTYRGKHLTVEDARLYTLPEQRPGLVVAAGGEAAASLAARKSDGIVAVEANSDLLETFDKEGEGNRKIGQVPMSYDRDEDKAKEFAMRFKFGVPGWKVMSELPNPVNFEAATQTVRPEDVLESTPAGSDPQPFADAIKEFVDAGYDEIAVAPVGDDWRGFMRFFMEEVKPALT